MHNSSDEVSTEEWSSCHELCLARLLPSTTKIGDELVAPSLGCGGGRGGSPLVGFGCCA